MDNKQMRSDEKPIKWLRSSDVREMLGISDSTLQTMRINKTLPAYKLGSTWFYQEGEIFESLLAGRNIKINQA
ncbi:MAG: helix-turn-helix domain-containing protein [Prolixibacteraceae bacterium]|nr:helix-turn-helix domain-containing protein [Prolixibacteraceae bacterium]